jgi:hypothetical protein
MFVHLQGFRKSLGEPTVEGCDHHHLASLICCNFFSMGNFLLQPTGENGATRVPIILEMERDKTGSSRTGLSIVLEGRVAAVSASKDLAINIVIIPFYEWIIGPLFSLQF